MKKILLTLAIALIATCSYAQRKVDLTTRLNFPTSSTTIRTGVPFSVNINVKNNGPDDIKVGDTLLYYIGTPTSYYPNSAYFLPNSSDMVVGDSLDFAIPNWTFTGPTGGQLTICGYVVLYNRALPDTVADLNLVQNKSCVTVTFSGMSIGELKGSYQFATSVYPNPASSNMTIEFNANADEKVKIEIYDMQGRLVNTINNLTENAGTQFIPLNVADMTKGIYFYKVTSGDNVSSSKFTVE